MKPVLREQALCRLFQVANYDPALRYLGFGHLIGWPKSSRCFLSAAALVSCALKSGAPLYEMSHSFIRMAGDRRMLTVATLYLASLSREMRGEVLIELKDPGNIRFNRPTARLWQKMGRGYRPPLKEIIEAVGPDDYSLFPPESEVQVYDSCRWVMESFRADERANLFTDCLGYSHLGEVPNLRRVLVNEALTCNQATLYYSVLADLPVFAREIVALLTETEVPGNREEARDLGRRLYQLAGDFLQRIHTLEESVAQAGLDRLAQSPHQPWLKEAAPHLLPRLSDNQIAAFIVDWFEQLWQDGSSSFHQLPYDTREQLNSALACLNLEALMATLRLAAATPAAHYERLESVCEAYLRKQLHDQSMRATTLPDLVNAGLVSSTWLNTVLAGMPPDWPELDNTLRTWLGQDRAGNSDALGHKSHVLELIIRRGLSAGRLLHQDNIINLIEWGYELQPEDLEREDAEALFFPAPDVDGSITGLQAYYIWRTDQWRNALLACERFADKSVAYILNIADVVADRTVFLPEKWLEVALRPAIEQHPHLQRALCQIAVSDPAATLARSFLGRRGQLPTWMKEEEKARLADFIRRQPVDCLWTISGIASLFIPLEEQRRLFFAKVLDRRRSDNYPGCDHWAYLFPDAASQVELRRWLAVNAHRFNPDCWLSWVEAYPGIAADPRIKKRAWTLLRQVEASTDFGDNDIRQRAIKIIRAE